MPSRKPARGRPPRNIKIKAVRSKSIDTEQLALVFWLQAKRMVRERREKGLPPLEHTPEQQTELERSDPEMAKLKRQLEKANEKLRELGVDPDHKSP